MGREKDERRKRENGVREDEFGMEMRNMNIHSSEYDV